MTDLILKKNVTIYYGLIMAIYSVGYVTMSAFSSVYLLDAGLDNGDVGMLLAVASILSVILQPLAGTLIDRSPKVSTRGVMLLIATLIVATGLLINFLPGKGVLQNSLLYGICIMLLMLAQPFLNSLGMDAVNYGYPINLGIGRGMGSMGYASASYAFGYVSVLVGPRSIPIAFSLAFFIMCILLFLYPVRTTLIDAQRAEEDRELCEKANHQKEQDNSAEEQDNPTEEQDNPTEEQDNPTEEQDNPFLFLVKYKRFTAMLGGLVLIYFSHVLLNTFALQIVTTKGGNSGSMGTASAIAAACEFVTTVFFVWYMSKIRIGNILKISGIFFTLKILCSFLVPSVGMFYLIQVLQMFGWGFMGTGIVFYVNGLVGERDKAQGQAYAGMAYTIAAVLGTFLGGNLIDAFGVDMMLIAGTVSAAIGTIIIWLTAE